MYIDNITQFISQVVFSCADNGSRPEGLLQRGDLNPVQLLAPARPLAHLLHRLVAVAQHPQVVGPAGDIELYLIPYSGSRVGVVSNLKSTSAPIRNSHPTNVPLAPGLLNDEREDNIFRSFSGNAD